ncbi:N-acetylneuraminate synthase family protein [Magnetospirillum sp. 64-120]|uniref:N-acetylneuraminate synthase family protein n=1 Tax=Magnetospirillum sp. 64-120 TaxID=1895778 RepID=UPI0009289C4D|nr:N-acetylneuraminate synthase family protein [Magnetospirillum sp. 64-120]OJX70352.1 MAG: acetylneuraminic acid synthetase [Magnetospirillum sp. 64-120]
MIIDRDRAAYCIAETETLAEALRRVDQNRARVIFTADRHYRLTGVLSDGDLRRWLIAHGGADLSVAVSTIARPHFVFARIGDPAAQVESLFGRGVDVVPLLDGGGHVVAFARAGGGAPAIGGWRLGPDSPCFIIAEIGNNHNGDPDLARRLIDCAHEAGADCVKFQMRDISRLYRNGGQTADLREDLGTQYTLDLLARFNLPASTILELMDYAHGLGMVALCTPWDMGSVEILERWGVEAFKIASADLTNHDLLRRVAQAARPILLSTGMSREAEIRASVDLLKATGVPLVLLHCNSTYPAPLKDVNLAYMTRLAEQHDCLVGYSGHERGIVVPIAAVAMGAKVVEKHFTLDPNMEGVDHKVSLTPLEFAQMVRSIRDVETAVGQGGPRLLSQGEMINRENLAKSLVATRAIAKGECLAETDMRVASPGRGLQPDRRGDLIGRRATRFIEAGDFFYDSDLCDEPVGPRPYTFRRPWGIPVRYHDAARMVTAIAPSLLEYHLSYHDLDVNPEHHLCRVMDSDLIVHAPELFAGDFLLDLCSEDDGIRERSLAEMTRVIQVARSLRRFHRPQTRPVRIVTNVGGFSKDAPRPQSDVTGLYRRLEDCLARLDLSGVEILPQTMPPFPWHFGGQSYHNAFVDPAEIAAYCADAKRRICLDISHSQLACTQAKLSMRDFLDKVGPYVGHMHVADARGSDGEGLQIGDGDIDFGTLAAHLDQVAPHASFIPEIWQGHKNDGEGFWLALERLERWF